MGFDPESLYTEGKLHITFAFASFVIFFENAGTTAYINNIKSTWLQQSEAKNVKSLQQNRLAASVNCSFKKVH